MAMKFKKKDVVPKFDTAEDEDDEQDIEMEEHVQKFIKYYEPGVLNYKHHKKFVMNLSFYAEQSGVPLHFMYNTSKGILTKKDKSYMDDIFDSDTEVSGAIFYGDNGTNMERMYALGGLLLRNFKDAKIVMAQDLIKSLKKDDDVNNSVVMVPNFCLHKESGGDISTWDAASLLAWVLGRNISGKQTILYSDTRNLIRDKFGTVLHSHIEHNFKELNKKKV